MNYQIAIVGASGRGKTYAARNLDRTSTGFLNAENKPLPFPRAFNYMSSPTTLGEVKSMLLAFKENPEIKTVFIDSWSAILDILLKEARDTKRGFDIWNMYNEEVGKILNFIKKMGKDVIITAHYEILGIEGAQEKRIKIKGKEWEGLVEKEFTVVLFADNKINEQGQPEYFLNLFQEGTSAKCPPALLTEEGVFRIPNDYKVILDKVEEFRNL